jgi:hypothetical protein
MEQATRRVIEEVYTERVRHKDVEGWTEKHDDAHERGELALAAASYACNAASYGRLGGIFATTAGKPTRLVGNIDLPDFLWPWSRQWWKPKNPRRDLIRAAALIIAEIERLDRHA